MKFLIDKIKKFKTVIVSGCQRSGTTIIAQMIANDAKYNFIDEKLFCVNNFEKFKKLDKENSVVHCPAICHLLDKMDKNFLIIYVMRNKKDVIQSMKRIKWDIKCEKKERKNYENIYGKKIDENIDIYDIKLEYWNNVQKKKINNYLELNYESDYVKNNALFIQKEKRKDFKSKQTKI